MYISKEERALLKEKLLKEIEEDLTSDGSQTFVEDDNITVEVDGKVVTDSNALEVEESKDALDGYGAKLALTDMLLLAINDENTTIQFYNNLIAACIDEGYEDIAKVIKHINEEENIHVGMLQHAMTTISELAKTIEDGVVEAEEIMSEESISSKDEKIN